MRMEQQEAEATDSGSGVRWEVIEFELDTGAPADDGSDQDYPEMVMPVLHPAEAVGY